MNTKNEIRIAAALVVREDGKTLLVRKRGSTAFMQPGGKIEAHESPIQALCRELREELRLYVDPADPHTHSAVAAVDAMQADRSL